jgi:hypothetical protein
MNRNIVFGAAGSEVLRVNSTGLSLANNTTLYLPETLGVLTWTHSVTGTSFTTQYTYNIFGNNVILTIGAFISGMSFASAGTLSTSLPTAIRPTGSKTLSVYNLVLTIGSTATLVRSDILFTGQMALYGNIQSNGNIPSGQTNGTDCHLPPQLK